MWSQATYPPCSWFHLYCWESIPSNRWGQSHSRVKGRGRTSTLVHTLLVAHWGEAPVVGRTGFLFAKGYWWRIRSVEAPALGLRGGVGTVAEGWTLLYGLSKGAEFTAWHYVKEGCLHLFSFFLSLFPSFCSPSLFSLFSPTTLTGILQKETKFPRMVCQLNRDLHGLVTALKPTKTTKTLIADGQPVTIHGLDCEAHYRLSRTTLSTSCFFFDLLASMSPKVLKVFSSFITSLISYLFAFNLCLFGCSLP